MMLTDLQHRTSVLSEGVRRQSDDTRPIVAKCSPRRHILLSQGPMASRIDFGTSVGNPLEATSRPECTPPVRSARHHKVIMPVQWTPSWLSGGNNASRRGVRRGRRMGSCPVAMTHRDLQSLSAISDLPYYVLRRSSSLLDQYLRRQEHIVGCATSKTNFSRSGSRGVRHGDEELESTQSGSDAESTAEGDTMPPEQALPSVSDVDSCTDIEEGRIMVAQRKKIRAHASSASGNNGAFKALSAPAVRLELVRKGSQKRSADSFMHTFTTTQAPEMEARTVFTASRDDEGDEQTAESSSSWYTARATRTACMPCNEPLPTRPSPGQSPPRSNGEAELPIETLSTPASLRSKSVLDTSSKPTTETQFDVTDEVSKDSHLAMLVSSSQPQQQEKVQRGTLQQRAQRLYSKQRPLSLDLHAVSPLDLASAGWVLMAESDTTTLPLRPRRWQTVCEGKRGIAKRWMSERHLTLETGDPEARDMSFEAEIVQPKKVERTFGPALPRRTVSQREAGTHQSEYELRSRIPTRDKSECWPSEQPARSTKHSTFYRYASGLDKSSSSFKKPASSVERIDCTLPTGGTKVDRKSSIRGHMLESKESKERPMNRAHCEGAAAVKPGNLLRRAVSSSFKDRFSRSRYGSDTISRDPSALFFRPHPQRNKGEKEELERGVPNDTNPSQEVLLCTDLEPAQYGCRHNERLAELAYVQPSTFSPAPDIPTRMCTPSLHDSNPSDESVVWSRGQDRTKFPSVWDPHSSTPVNKKHFSNLRSVRAPPRDRSKRNSGNGSGLASKDSLHQGLEEQANLLFSCEGLPRAQPPKASRHGERPKYPPSAANNRPWHLRALSSERVDSAHTSNVPRRSPSLFAKIGIARRRSHSQVNEMHPPSAYESPESLSTSFTLRQDRRPSETVRLMYNQRSYSTAHLPADEPQITGHIASEEMAAVMPSYHEDVKARQDAQHEPFQTPTMSTYEKQLQPSIDWRDLSRKASVTRRLRLGRTEHASQIPQAASGHFTPNADQKVRSPLRRRGTLTRLFDRMSSAKAR